MENNFELEEMKQQWATLQTALNSQKEVNITLILKDARKRISWNRGLLRCVFFITILFAVPSFLFAFPRIGVPQPISITIALLMFAMALNALYMSFIIRTPNDSNIDVVKYSKSLVTFKRHYLWTEAFDILSLIAVVIWAVIEMGFDITHPRVIGAVIGGVVGAILGVSLALKVLNNIKELQSDIDLIEGLRE